MTTPAYDVRFEADYALLHYRDPEQWAGFVPTNMFRLKANVLQQFMLYDKNGTDGLWIPVPVLD